jgi:hypothetical protein
MTLLRKVAAPMLAVALAFSMIGIGAAVASQPQMDGALQALQAAQADLAKVTMDKDGHANKARKLVAAAIEQVEAGIAYGKAQGL